MTDDVVELAIRFPNAFVEFEFLYISNFVSDEEEAVAWMQSVGMFGNSVVEHLESPEAMASFARYIPDKKKKDRIRKEVVKNSKGAFIWGVAVPEDRELVKDDIQGSMWAYRWAKHVGNVEEMLERADHEFWRSKIKGEVLNDGDASFH